MQPSRDEIEEQMNKALDQINEGGSKWPGMSYEQGVESALRWALGDDDEVPMPDE